MSGKEIAIDERFRSLPAVVQKWLTRTNVIGREVIQNVHLHQRGELRTSPNAKWMTFEAEQYNKVQNPAFIWLAKVKAAPLITLTGRDTYANGKGEMLIKLFYLIPVVHAKGPQIDQGALVRYMAESVWFPSSAVADYFHWEQVDSSQAKVTMTYGGICSTGVFTFTSEGDVQSFEATRYFQRKQRATLEKWYVQLDPLGFKEFEGIRIPARATVTWKLTEGDFMWLKVEITHLEFE